MLLDLVRNVFEDIFRDVFVGVNVKTRFANSSPPHSVQVPTKGPSDVTLSQSARVLVMNVEVGNFILLLRIPRVNVIMTVSPIVAEHGNLRRIYNHDMIPAIVIWMKDGLVLATENVDYGFTENDRVLPRGIEHVPSPRERGPLLHAFKVTHGESL